MLGTGGKSMISTLLLHAVADLSRNCFNSDKVAEVSYASKYHPVPLTTPLTQSTAIQGKDCLVQKFRNSSVMLENPAFRPKVSLISV